MIIQWGTMNSNNSSPWNSFPIVFPNKAAVITFGYASMDSYGDHTFNNICWGYNFGASGMNLYSPYGSGVWYIVIGY